jgi:prolyl-tRNA synthetase
MGALIMSHSDNQGLVLPPKLAPIQVVIVPIYKDEEQLQKINAFAIQLKKELEDKDIRVKYDNRDNQRPGWKFADYEFKGVPLRIAIGGRDMENSTVELARRDTKEKQTVPQAGLTNVISGLLTEIQDGLFQKALKYRDSMIHQVENYEEFKDVLENIGGFISAHWDGTPETEERIKQETKATIRCIPLNNPPEDGVCILTGKPSTQRVLFAKAY